MNHCMSMHIQFIVSHPSSRSLPPLLSLSQQHSSLAKQASVVQQAKVSAWLHSSEDMDRCCRGREIKHLLMDLTLLKFSVSTRSHLL